MKLPSDVPAHDGPPNEAGWWLIQVPGGEPWLLHHDGVTDPTIARLWQPVFKAWRLRELAQVPKLEKVLSSLVGRPKVLWDMVRAMSFIRVASPWTKEDGTGAYKRYAPDGTELAKQTFFTHKWRAIMPGRETEHNSREEAQEACDIVLSGKGYFLLD
jgi:hypothetical protein